MRQIRKPPTLRQPTLMLAFAIMTLLAACGGSTDSTTAAAVEQQASDFPDFIAVTADGGQIDFGSLQGQDTVLWFWAPW